jgi:hypothetical protein
VSPTTITRRAAIGALAAGALAAAAPLAGAATVPVAGGSTALHLDGGTAAALAHAGISVAPVRPAAARGTRVTFPVTGGAIDPSSGAGTVSHSGGLTFSGHGTTVRLVAFRLRTTGTPVLTAMAGRARIPLLSIDTSRARVLRRGPGRVATWIVRAEGRLRPEAAGALNAAFGTHLAAGTRIGRLDVRTTPGAILLKGGATTLALDPGTAATLGSLGVTPSVISPGTASAAGLSFPITSGRLALPSLAGAIGHSGGIALTAGGTRVALTGFRIRVSATPTLSAVVNGGPTRVDLALDLSGARTGLSSRHAVVRGVKVALTAGAASALNTAFGTTALSAGVPLGVADVRAVIR